MSRITDIAKTMKTWWNEDDDPFVHRALDEIIRIDQEQAPTIEPKRGKWGLMRTVKYNSCPEHWLKCSACGNFRIIKVGEAFPHFCENCGADMRGKDDE